MLKVIVILYVRGNLIICGINSIWVSCICIITYVYYLLYVFSIGFIGNFNGLYLSFINIWVVFFLKFVLIF